MAEEACLLKAQVLAKVSKHEFYIKLITQRDNYSFYNA